MAAQDRLARIRAHLQAIDVAVYVASEASPAASPDPAKLATVLPPPAQAFLAGLANAFRVDVRALHVARLQRQLELDLCSSLEEAHATCVFRNGPYVDGDAWTIDPLPEILHDRRVDIGDTSPARTDELLAAINSGAQGVQVDMDDGHCPSWKNVIHGHWNLLHAARGTLPGIAHSSPALLLPRPRAWNMDEEHVLVHGHAVPGALFDFGLHMFHSAAHLIATGRGPFFYLPKLESAAEAALWARVFAYTEATLGLPVHSIKAIVLIEHILAAFEMDAILYELRHYSAGLNCGMWDYTASILSKFRSFPAASLPDRQAYVSMQTPFLAHYMRLLLATCARRRAPATTGMVPFVLEHATPAEAAVMLEKTRAAKSYEANCGSHGALVFDVSLVPVVQEIFAQKSPRVVEAVATPTPRDLLTLPRGHVTMHSVDFNLRVVLAYIEAWGRQDGIVVLDHSVEDSATAEIARSQLWHWIKFEHPLQDTDCVVSIALVHALLAQIAHAYAPATRRLTLHVLQVQRFPTFLTSFLQSQRLLWQ